MKKYIKRYSVYRNCWEIGYYNNTQFIIVNIIRE